MADINNQNAEFLHRNNTKPFHSHWSSHSCELAGVELLLHYVSTVWQHVGILACVQCNFSSVLRAVKLTYCCTFRQSAVLASCRPTGGGILVIGGHQTLLPPLSLYPLQQLLCSAGWVGCWQVEGSCKIWPGEPAASRG